MDCNSCECRICVKKCRCDNCDGTIKRCSRVEFSKPVTCICGNIKQSGEVCRVCGDSRR